MMKMTLIGRVAAFVFCLAVLGCGGQLPSGGASVARVPMSYVRRFHAPKERTLRATTAALATLGHEVTFADPERGVLQTSRGGDHVTSPSEGTSGVRGALVISVYEEAPGRSVVSGYLRTFVGDRETTRIGAPNDPSVDEVWTRLFAEVASRLP